MNFIHKAHQIFKNKQVHKLTIIYDNPQITTEQDESPEAVCSNTLLE